MELMVQLSDEDLLSRLRNDEDNFVERKMIADQKDVLKTVVAFANSAPIGLPCVVYIGVKDGGAMEDRDTDFDDLQKKINRLLQRTYPRFPCILNVIADGAKRALALIVPGSAIRSHFAGPSYIRVGSQSEEASRTQFENLIARQNSEAYRLSQFLGKEVSLEVKTIFGNGVFTLGNSGSAKVLVTECNESWVTVQYLPGTAKNPIHWSMPN